MRRSIAATGSALFFVLAPGVVAGLIPYWLSGWQARDPSLAWQPVRPIGGALIVVGALALISAFLRFVLEGAGTPAPVAPTERLVVGGLYRYVRNPMYLAVLAIILGQALLFANVRLLAYAAAVWVGFATFVKLYEEPTLKRRYGEQYEAYRRAVPAWRPRLRAWTSR
jgi:protein-S-isoprenylcysteine O-methyltransferase Ste14